jgi:quercetin 2,3-dioxygenase
MTSATATNHIEIYGTDRQAVGAFDGGRITETKPIGFPGEGSAVDRIGPLFYWAWASSKDEGKIGLHPHQGFEIASYVISGKLGHYDTLGTRRAVGPGGIQVMQTGSGVSHEEAMLEPNTQFLQIWFEPHLAEAVKREPTYADYEANDLVTEVRDGVETTPLIGDGSPVKLVADGHARAVSVAAGAEYRRDVEPGRSLATLVIEGEGELDDGRTAGERDFLVLNADERAAFTVTARGSRTLRLIEIDVPTTVDYPLYRKR